MEAGSKLKDTDMKRIILSIITLLAVLTGCEEKPKALDITGTWELTGIEITKAAQLGEETIEVTITFNADNTFQLTQMLGQGRAQEFGGTWSLTENTLSGKYDNGKDWGSTYTISLEGTTLTMIPESGAETYVYTKKN